MVNNGGVQNAFVASTILLVVSGILYGIGYAYGLVHVQNISQEVLGASLAVVATTAVIKYA